MLGIDHDKAPLAVREKFSLTKKQAAGCAARLRGLGAGGAVVPPGAGGMGWPRRAVNSPSPTRATRPEK